MDKNFNFSRMRIQDWISGPLVRVVCACKMREAAPDCSELSCIVTSPFHYVEGGICKVGPFPPQYRQLSQSLWADSTSPFSSLLSSPQWVPNGPPKASSSSFEVRDYGSKVRQGVWGPSNQDDSGSPEVVNQPSFPQSRPSLILSTSTYPFVHLPT